MMVGSYKSQVPGCRWVPSRFLPFSVFPLWPSVSSVVKKFKTSGNAVVLSLPLLILFSSCKQSLVTEDQLKKYVLDEDHGVRKVVHSGELKVDAVLRPTDLLVLQELRGNAKDTAALTRLQRKYAGQYYFILNISRDGREVVTPGQLSYDHFSDVLQNVSFRMGEFVNMTTAKQDTIPLMDFMFNRTFGMGSGSEVLLVFDKKKIRDADWLQINLSELGLGLGLQNFRFRRSDLVEVPHLDFKKLSDRTI